MHTGFLRFILNFALILNETHICTFVLNMVVSVLHISANQMPASLETLEVKIAL